MALPGWRGMMENVARLKRPIIAGLLKHEILGEVFAVVADVQPREEDVAAGIKPEDAELAELILRQRLARARVAPAHVPRVFEKDGAVVFLLHLLGEKRFVERREILAHEERDVDVARQLDRLVVRRLDLAPRGDGVDEQLLRAIRVYSAEA